MNNDFFNDNEVNNINQDLVITDSSEHESIANGRITINTSKKSNKGIKAVAIGMAVIIGGTSLGVGAGIGYNYSKSYIASTDFGDDTSNFKFADNETQVVSDDDIMLASTNTVAPIINKVKDSVVNISIKTQSRDFFNQVYESEGAGSGIIYSEDDTKVYIVTNNHVIEDATSVTISITGEEEVPAKLVGKNAQADLAVIYVTKEDMKKAGIETIQVANFADSDAVEVGEYVLALGNALGEGKIVTQGIISAQNKTINIDGKKLTVLQTDAAINPGNSGGALVNTDGEVIGINTAKLSSSAIEGIGYAIPSSVVKEIVSEIMEGGSAEEKPYFGITGFTITDAFRQRYNLDVEGVFIQSVDEGSSAESAGIQYTDIITSFNGQKITTIEELSKAITACKINDTVSLTIIRNGNKEMTLSAVLTGSNSTF